MLSNKGEGELVATTQEGLAADSR